MRMRVLIALFLFSLHSETKKIKVRVRVPTTPFLLSLHFETREHPFIKDEDEGSYNSFPFGTSILARRPGILR